MTKERLKTYRDLKQEQQQIRQQLETLEAAMYYPKPQRLSGMPSAPSQGNALENMVEQHVALQERYRAKLSELEAEQLAIETAIDALDTRARQLIRYRYLDGLTWEEVCVAMSYSWRQTHRLHSAALTALKEMEENSGIL